MCQIRVLPIRDWEVEIYSKRQMTQWVKSLMSK
jgi:hypothetical protein